MLHDLSRIFNDTATYWWVALVITAMGGIVLLKNLLLLLIGIRTEAEIYYLYIFKHTPEGPYIRYTTADNQVIDKKMRSKDDDDDSPMNPARRKTTILYLPSWPKLYVERTFSALVFTPLVFLGVGITFLLYWPH